MRRIWGRNRRSDLPSGPPPQSGANADELAALKAENTRLANETREALEQQTAVSGVLASISRAAFDLDSVLTTVVQNACRLANAPMGVLFRLEGTD